MTEEVRNPKRNLPLSIFIAIPLVTVVYILTNISYFSVMSREELLASPAVASLWGERMLGGAAILIPIAVACSTFGSINGTAFAGGRQTFVAAREGHLPEVISFVHVTHYTPLSSLVVNTTITLLLLIPGYIQSLIDFFSFTSWLFYGSTVAALLFLRYKRPDAIRPIKAPIIIPILFLLCSIYLVVGPIINQPKMEFLYAALFILGGLILYFPFVHFKMRIPGMDTLTMWLQLLAEVSPSTVAPDDS